MSKYATLTIIDHENVEEPMETWYVLSNNFDMGVREVYKETRPYKMTDEDLFNAGPTPKLKHELEQEGYKLVQWDMPIAGGASNV